MAAFIIFKRSGPLVCKKSKWMSLLSQSRWGMMREGPGGTSGKLSHMWQEKSQILMQSLIKNESRPLWQEPLTSALWGAVSHLANQPQQRHHRIKRRWAAAEGKGRGWCTCSGVWNASPSLILGQQRRNQASARVRHANTRWDLGWPLYFPGPQFPHLYKWGSDTAPSGRCLPLPTPWEILIVIISCPLEGMPP